MASLNSHISWTDSTWNPTTGCTKVSPGCLHCYAEALTNRLWGGGFETVKEHPDRLRQVRQFGPIIDGSTTRPRMVFVNSMSDLMHDDIADAFRDQVFETMEGAPRTVFQILTKRPMTLRRYIEARYGGRGVPSHLWLGCSVEDNRVRGRIDMLRRLKDAVGDFTAFLSVEPLIGPADRHDYTGIEWVLIGGESGIKARPCEPDWARQSRDLALAAGSAVWFKQWGTWVSNPLYQAAAGPLHLDKVRQAIGAGEALARIEPHPKTGRPSVFGEKGGATLDGRTWRDLPPAYAAMRAPSPTLV